MENEINVNGQINEDAPAENAIGSMERIEQLRTEQNLPLGILTGVSMAFIGALFWALFTITTNYQVGYMAVVVGLMVGYGVRIGGKGIDSIFGYIGAALAFLGCLMGNFFSQITFIAQYNDIQYYEIFETMDFYLFVDIIAESFVPIDLLFYGIAIYEGYRFSFRKAA